MTEDNTTKGIMTKGIMTEGIMTEDNNETMNIGMVKWFDNRKGYGFIRDLNKDKDLFVHFSNISVKKEATYKKLYPCEYVSYGLEEKDGREVCVNVTGVHGGPLLTDSVEYNYKVYPKQMNTRSMDTSVMNNHSSSSNDDKSDVDSDAKSDDSDGDGDDEEKEEKEEKEFINKEVPEGLEVAEIEGLHISETLGQ